jgi:hypothetical protein
MYFFYLFARFSSEISHQKLPQNVQNFPHNLTQIFRISFSIFPLKNHRKITYIKHFQFFHQKLSQKSENFRENSKSYFGKFI